MYNMVDRSGMLVRWVHKFCEGRESIYESIYECAALYCALLYCALL